VNAILEALAATPGIHRKELSEKLIAGVAIEDADSRKLALASDLHWLIGEGHVIEFNDGSLDLPRKKAKETQASESPIETRETEVDAESAHLPTTLSAGSESPLS